MTHVKVRDIADEAQRKFNQGEHWIDIVDYVLSQAPREPLEHVEPPEMSQEGPAIIYEDCREKIFGKAEWWQLGEFAQAALSVVIREAQKRGWLAREAYGAVASEPANADVAMLQEKEEELREEVRSLRKQLHAAEVANTDLTHELSHSCRAQGPPTCGYELDALRAENAELKARIEELQGVEITEEQIAAEHEKFDAGYGYSPWSDRVLAYRRRILALVNHFRRVQPTETEGKEWPGPLVAHFKLYDGDDGELYEFNRVARGKDQWTLYSSAEGSSHCDGFEESKLTIDAALAAVGITREGGESC